MVAPPTDLGSIYVQLLGRGPPSPVLTQNRGARAVAEIGPASRPAKPAPAGPLELESEKGYHLDVVRLGDDAHSRMWEAVSA
jgi:hypothetical protein